MLANAPILSRSKLQTCVALSSTEAEYIAASYACQETIWLRRLLSELGYLNLSTATELYEDNEPCIRIAENNQIESRTKHIDIRYHFIRQAIQEKNICLKSINTIDQPADLLTKQQSITRFRKLKGMIGITKYVHNEGVY